MPWPFKRSFERDRNIKRELEEAQDKLARASEEVEKLRVAQEHDSGLRPSELGVVVNTTIVNPALPDLPAVLPSECAREGNYRVTFRWDETPQGTAYLDLSSNIHSDSPLLSTMKPYTGPLCEHEMEFLVSAPGVKHTPMWVFKVTPVEKKVKK